MDRAGNKYMRSTEREILEVVVDRGAYDGQKIVFDGKGDIQEGMRQGDVVLVVKVGEHPVFKRKGADLFYQKTLTLAESLCGFKFAIPHLDNRQLLVSSNEGDVVKPDSFKAVYDEGMPIWQRSLEKGRLFIHFDVTFPEPGDLGDREIAALAALLPPRPPLEVEIDACQEVSVTDIDMESEMRRQQERQADEEDDDERGGRGGVQCAQQ
jgi:DnaJ family protein A protein 2